MCGFEFSVQAGEDFRRESGALNRKNALFAGSDGGGEHWAIIASLVETCKLCGIDPEVYLAETLARIINGHLNSPE